MADEPLKQTSEANLSPQKDFKEFDELVIPDELKTVLSDPGLSEEKKKIILRAIVTTSVRKASSFSGPVPPPEILKGYNEVLQNGAERILMMAEKQSNHRMQLEDHAIKEELKQSRLGQVFGFILGLVGFGLATTLAMFNHEAIAGIFGTTTILGLVTVFVLGKRAQQKDLSDKSD